MLAALAAQVQAGAILSREEMCAATQAMLAENLDKEGAQALLVALSARGESADEILGACDAIMAQAKSFSAPAEAVDVCGTGGDNSHSLNISTTAAFIVAACGVAVVKHGNRSVSSRAGSSDILAALGLAPTLPHNFWQDAIAKTGIAFLYAPAYHPGLAHIAPVRRAIGQRTIFNLLGPLCNPARISRQVMGVYSEDKAALIAEVLHMRGSERAWVLHGADGMDEISISSDTFVWDVSTQGVTRFSLSPADAGYGSFPEHALVGGDAAANAAALLALFEGAGSDAYRQASEMNAAAALIVAGKAHTFKEGAAMAKEALASGETLALLQRLQGLSRENSFV